MSWGFTKYIIKHKGLLKNYKQPSVVDIQLVLFVN